VILATRAGALDLSRPRVMGILNTTPDSFSDGGDHLTPEAAIARAEVMVEDGADLIDIGGESSRPGAAPVPAEEELRRVVPIVEILAQRLPHVPISVDTTKAAVARAACDAGASLVNDISALRFDARMADVLRAHDVPVILMHMQGTPADMQANPVYGDVVEDIKLFFRERLAFLAARGLKNAAVLDPGIGFGKRFEHNLEILRRLKEFRDLERPLLVGPSRKAFLGRLLAGDGTTPPPHERDAATAVACLWAVQAGARLVRVHDVKGVRQALRVWEALGAGAVADPGNRRG